MERVYSFNHGVRTSHREKIVNPAQSKSTEAFYFLSRVPHEWICPVEINYCRNLVHLQYGEIGFLTNIHNTLWPIRSMIYSKFDDIAVSTSCASLKRGTIQIPSVSVACVLTATRSSTVRAHACRPGHRRC